MTQAIEQPVQRIQKLEINDYMRIEALNIDAQGNHVRITGPNASGKTSAVQCIWQTLQGWTSKETPEPVRHGADSADSTIVLDDYTISRVWKGDTCKLVVTAKDGTNVKRPQEFLNTLLGPARCLDPVAFLYLKPADQVATVLETFGVKAPVTKVTKITGETIPALKNESASDYITRVAGDGGVLHTKRKDANKERDNKERDYDAALENLTQLGGAPTEADKAESTEGLLKQQQEAYGKQRDYEAHKKNLADAEKFVTTVENDILTVIDAGKAQVELKKDLEAQIAKLQERLETCNTKISDLTARHKELSKDTLVKAKATVAEQKEKLAQLEDPQTFLDEINGKLSAVVEKDKLITQRQTEADRVKKLSQEFGEVAKKAKEYDEAIKAVRNLRSTLLEGVDLGVPDLVVGEGELRYQGKPFRQASKAQQIRVACSIAMKEKPAIRVLRIDDGEHLDNESLAEVYRIAESNDFQVIMAAVAPDATAMKVEIIDKE